MNNYINYNELRKLAAKVEKKRPILGSLLIKDGVGYFTDSIYLVVMGGYNGTPDMVINLNTYGTPVGEYPNMDAIIKSTYLERKYERVLYGAGVIYQFQLKDNEYRYFDQEHLDQIKRLLKVKQKFQIDVTKIKTSAGVGMYEINEDTKIYFALKRKIDKDESKEDKDNV